MKLKDLNTFLSLHVFGVLEVASLKRMVLISKRVSLIGGKTNGRLLNSHLKVQFSITMSTLNKIVLMNGSKYKLKKLILTLLNQFRIILFLLLIPSQHNSLWRSSSRLMYHHFLLVMQVAVKHKLLKVFSMIWLKIVMIISNK